MLVADDWDLGYDSFFFFFAQAFHRGLEDGGGSHGDAASGLALKKLLEQVASNHVPS